MSTRSVLVEIGEVVRATPRPGAQPVEVAAWYQRKARLLEHIAVDGGTGAAGAVECARQARRRAAELDPHGAVAGVRS
ncbi:hypothetical protein ACU61A_27265 [Pseudonocardia sichuanensis]